MSSPFNKCESKYHRRYLRKNLPAAEKLLWKKIRNRQLNGLRFRRQYSIFNYILDFYCPEYKLALEIIGDVHGYSTRHRTDLTRKEKIESLGIKILFYTNTQVQDEMEGVLQDILSNLPPTPFYKEGESWLMTNKFGTKLIYRTLHDCAWTRRAQ